jgi:ATP-binding cassette subfamily C (CFTR/MRP) protein 1
MSISNAFTSVSILGLVVSPLASLFGRFPMFIGTTANLERIQKYLEQCGEKSGPGKDDLFKDDLDEEEESHIGNGSVSNQTASHTGPSEDLAIMTHNACFSLKPDVEPILRDVNVHLKRSSLTIITGKVGSGKSIMLKALLGELHTTGTMSRMTSTAAYCAQTAWLVNDTVRQNILGESKWDEAWYESVVNACALDHDFHQFPKGDLSLVGSKGISLSGGQKNRVVRTAIGDYVYGGPGHDMLTVP